MPRLLGFRPFTAPSTEEDSHEEHHSRRGEHEERERRRAGHRAVLEVDPGHVVVEGPRREEHGQDEVEGIPSPLAHVPSRPFLLGDVSVIYEPR